MKKLSVHPRNHQLPSGTSLIELLIVLGISSMIVAASFAWFSSKRSTDFADNTRQIESVLREVQNEISTNSAPGYNASSAQCNNGDINRANCVLKSGDQILASGVGVNSGIPLADTRTLQIYYFKVGKSAAAPANVPLAEVSAYSTRKVVLPAGIHFEWIKVINRTGTSCSTVDKNYIDPAIAVGGVVQAKGWSIVSFRRDPAIMNSFSGPVPSSNIVAAASVATQLPAPPFSGEAYGSANSATNPHWYPSWGGDNPANYTAGVEALPSLPCAVMWRLESDEKTGVNARFSAEIVFNLDQQKITVQRR